MLKTKVERVDAFAISAEYVKRILKIGEIAEGEIRARILLLHQKIALSKADILFIDETIEQFFPGTCQQDLE